ncbi:SGNH/GDSL hydrolase family protein [Intestinibacter bartlettii]|uniref:Putative lipase/acylhydrolase domain-containing protein n=1 Tax=Intestinibacter bartlettii CAG:1329 TaxID=1263063 RepID=R5XQW1_9FIRM|nr:lipase/acylhydrolase [Intestinibacter bartlettii]CDA11186.1 putative lipase/acylhydrolase domain-containing protein [Intestinibacter bartlettii CAG:1329]
MAETDIKSINKRPVHDTKAREDIEKLSSQYKDIANLSLTKHTDGKVYIKKQDGTLLGAGIEISGSDVDLSKITMSMSGQTLKLLNNGAQIATVEIPTAVVTDEQLTSIIQSKIDDGTLTNMTITDNSITPQKTDFFNVIDITNSVIETTWGDGGYNAVKTDYVDAIDEIYVIINSVSGAGNEIKIDYYNSSKTLISTYTPDNDFYTKYRETIFTSPTGGSSVDYAFARIVTFKLPIKELKPEGTVYIKITASYIKTGDSCELRKTLDTRNGKYISLDDKYNNDLIKNIDISNTNFKTISNNSLLNYKKVAVGSTDFPGNNILYFTDYIDTSANKEIYIRFAINSSMQITNFSDVALYDENKQYIKTVYANPGSDTSKEQANFAVIYNDMTFEANKELENGEKVKTITIVKLTVPDEAKYIRFGNIDLYIKQFAKLWNFLYVSYEPITNTYRMTDTYNVEINTDFKELVNECIEKPKKTMCCIGDSLTNWGGGTDSTDGFLKIVHDKTGVMTNNRGHAGAWWQIQNNDESINGTSAVNRVDYIVANNEKFNLYCFIMGSNAGSSTDTGETSSNKTTMCGAIRYCMETLKAHDPTAQILVCLPPQRAEGNDGQLLVNGVIKKIVEDEYSVRTLDLYRHSGVVPNTTIANANYLSDGLHLGDNGKTAIGNTLASEVKYMLCL